MEGGRTLGGSKRADYEPCKKMPAVERIGITMKRKQAIQSRPAHSFFLNRPARPAGYISNI